MSVLAGLTMQWVRLVVDVKCPKQKVRNNFILSRRGMITSWVRPRETD